MVAWTWAGGVVIVDGSGLCDRPEGGGEVGEYDITHDEVVRIC